MLLINLIKVKTYNQIVIKMYKLIQILENQLIIKINNKRRNNNKL